MTPDRHALIENLRETLEAAQLISTSLAESREIVGRFLPIEAARSADLIGGQEDMATFAASRFFPGSRP